MSELSVTIKYDRGHDSTWAVFRGTPGEIRQDITEYFGLERESVAGLTLNQLVQNVTQVAHSGATAGAQLGAVALPSKSTDQALMDAIKTPAPAPAPAEPILVPAPSTPNDDPWGAVEAKAEASQSPSAPAEPERSPLYELIDSTTTVVDLQKLWATNQAAFSDAELMQHWKAKGRALSAAA